jgi:ketosteroid isomerase-like protein
MSEQNVEMVRRAFEAFNRGNTDAVVADMAPDVEYVATGTIPGFGGVFRGAEEYKRFIGWVSDEFDDARVEPNEFIDAGDQVVASLTISGRGRQSGVETSWNIWQVWTLQEGKLVRGQGFTSREEALEAAGLSG